VHDVGLSPHFPKLFLHMFKKYIVYRQLEYVLKVGKINMRLSPVFKHGEDRLIKLLCVNEHGLEPNRIIQRY
jgi:hypothetical protein